MGEDVEELEPSGIAGGAANSAAAVRNSLAVPQKVKPELPYDMAIPIPGMYPKELRADT